MEQLLSLLQKQPDDGFLLYAVAMEYRKNHDTASALATFERLLTLHPDHAYAWYQKGQTLLESGQRPQAQQAFRDGIEAAKRAGDDKARGELEWALLAAS